jgi:hypothetical protein
VASEHRGQWPPLLIAVQLLCVSFLLSYWVELRFYDARLFYRWDVLTHADPNRYLRIFTDMETPAHLVLRHPLLPIVTHYPLALVASILTKAGVTTATTDELRVWLALFIVPAANAIRTGILFAAMRRFTRRMAPAMAVALLDVAAFATLTVGSVPESYPLSATCIAALYALTVSAQRDGTPVRVAWWILAGTLAVGITVTNAIPLVVLRFASLRRLGTSFPRAMVQTAGTLALAAMLILAVAAAGYRTPFSVREGVSRTQSALGVSFAPSRLAEIGWSVAHTFMAPAPGRQAHVASPAQAPAQEFILSFAPPYRHAWGSWWRALVTGAVFIAGVLGHRRSGGMLNIAAPAAIVLSNAILHVFFGDHFALYMLHWSTSLLWILAGSALVVSRGGRRTGEWLLWAFVLATASNSLVVMGDLFATLSSY